MSSPPAQNLSLTAFSTILERGDPHFCNTVQSFVLPLEVTLPFFKKERLTDWGGQMTIQVSAGANPGPLTGFSTQGRQGKRV